MRVDAEDLGEDRIPPAYLMTLSISHLIITEWSPFI